MKTSIIVPVYNAHEYTENCLRSICKHTEAGSYEVILIDNGSKPKYLYETMPEGVNQKNTTIYHSKQNMGFPAAVNLGMQIASQELVCILNNDLVVTPGWLDRLKDYIEKDLLDVVGPTTNSISGPQQVPFPYYSDQDELNALCDKLYIERCQQFSRLYRLVGFCLLMKKSTWVDVGGFDEIFTPGNFEDDDFCLRAIEKGYRLGYAHDVFLHHFGSVTHGLLGINYNSLIAQNMKKFYGKWTREQVEALIEKNGG